MVLPKKGITRNILVSAAYLCGTAVLVFGVLVVSKILFKVSAVRAANAVSYPNFCLGGWDHPQNASGDPGASTDPASYSIENSAYLKSSVSSQIFCGYFAAPEKTNPPAKVLLHFNWNMKPLSGVVSSSTPTHPVDSFSSGSGYLISTSTGFTVPVQTNPVPIVPPAIDSSTSPSQSQTPTSQTVTPSSVPVIPPTDTSQTPPDPTPAVTPVSTPPPAPEPAAPASAPAEASPTSFIGNFFSLIAQPVYASTIPSMHSSNPFLEVSYSIDGIRWVSVGTVGMDNWNGYTISVPVSSWADVSHLQVMLSVLPSIDARPDIFLENIAATVSYDRTTGEVIADAAAAASDAADVVVDLVTGKKPVEVAPKEPVHVPLVITKKKLLFSVDQRSISRPAVERAGEKKQLQRPAIAPSAIAVSVVGDSSASISGKCSKKYFVILIFKAERDYIDKPSSFIANEAHDCINGNFSYDLASLSPEIRSGSYYLMTGEEDDTGPWDPISNIYPLGIQASTTSQTIEE